MLCLLFIATSGAVALRANAAVPGQVWRRARTSAGTRRLLVLLVLSLARLPPTKGQTPNPTSLNFPDTSFVCRLMPTIETLCVTLPESSTTTKTDVFLLFDDTGSFSGIVPDVADIFQLLVSDLQEELPDVEFGFGIGRFEDFNCCGGGAADQPFILNQPIVTSKDAMDAGTDLNTIISASLSNTAPGGGTDGPETAIEALFQVATGNGFDSDGDGDTTGNPINSRLAGSIKTQTTIVDYNGDVPAFSTLVNTVVTSGVVGGAGFRSDALKLVILATDQCSVAPFDASTTEITSVFDSVNISSYECGDRNDLDNPERSATVQDTIDALVDKGIRVIGLNANSAQEFLEATAHLTNAVNEAGDPLVFPVELEAEQALVDAIVEAVQESSTLPIDIGIAEDCTDLDMALSINLPGPEMNVAPGDTACFDVEFDNTNDELSGTCTFTFEDDMNGLELAAIPTSFDCSGARPTTKPTALPTKCPPTGHRVRKHKKKFHHTNSKAKGSNGTKGSYSKGSKGGGHEDNGIYGIYYALRHNHMHRRKMRMKKKRYSYLQYWG